MTDYQTNSSYHTSSANFSSNHSLNNLKKSTLLYQNVQTECLNDNCSPIAFTNFPGPYLSNGTRYLINQYQEYDDNYRDSSFILACNMTEPSRLNLSVESDDNPKISENLDSTDVKVYPWMKKNHGCNDYGMMIRFVNF